MHACSFSLDELWPLTSVTCSIAFVRQYLRAKCALARAADVTRLVAIAGAEPVQSDLPDGPDGNPFNCHSITTGEEEEDKNSAASVCIYGMSNECSARNQCRIRTCAGHPVCSSEEIFPSHCADRFLCSNWYPFLYWLGQGEELGAHLSVHPSLWTLQPASQPARAGRPSQGPLLARHRLLPLGRLRRAASEMMETLEIQ